MKDTTPPDPSGGKRYVVARLGKAGGKVSNLSHLFACMQTKTYLTYFYYITILYFYHVTKL